MDRFAMNTGLIGWGLGLLAVVLLVTGFSLKAKKKVRWGGLLNSVLGSVFLAALAAAFISISLFVRTYNLMASDTRIGKVCVMRNGPAMDIQFADEANQKSYGFELCGDQWMIEGYILRWKPFLRFLGAQPYYKVTRFSGRWESSDSTHINNHQLWIEPGHWKWLLQYGQKFPLIDAVQGIAAFQYPSTDTFKLFITNAGFVLKK